MTWNFYSILIQSGESLEPLSGFNCCLCYHWGVFTTLPILEAELEIKGNGFSSEGKITLLTAVAGAGDPNLKCPRFQNN